MPTAPSTRRASPASLLPAALALVLGLGAGYLLAVGLERPAATPPSRQVLAAPGADSALPSSADSLAGDLTAPASSTQVARSAARAPEPASIEDPAATAAEAEAEPRVSASLHSELSEFLRSGAIEEQLGTQPERMVRYLAQMYTTHGRPHEALELLQRHDSQNAGLYERAGRALLKAGDPDAARTAYLIALEQDPFDEDRVEALTKLDPGGALAILDSKAVELGLLASGPVAAQRASLLAAMGREDEARQAALEAISGDTVGDESWDVLVGIDSAAAEAAMRERLAEDESGLMAARLAQLIGKDESRSGEAVAILEGLLQRDQQSSQVWLQMLELAPERALDLLASSDTSEVEPWVLSRAGDQLAEQGRMSDAVDAWAESFGRNPDDDGAREGLFQNAPERLWAQCRATARTSTNDEVLGDLADLYWSKGRQDEAVELWRRANAIDSDDGEWTGKLHSVALGKDPL